MQELKKAVAVKPIAPAHALQCILIDKASEIAQAQKQRDHYEKARYRWLSVDANGEIWMCVKRPRICTRNYQHYSPGHMLYLGDIPAPEREVLRLHTYWTNYLIEI